MAMNKDQIDRSANEIDGTVNQRVGRAIDDVKPEANGKADKPDDKVEVVVPGRPPLFRT